MEQKELKDILEKYFKTYGVYASLDNDGDKAIDSIILAMQEVAKLSHNNAIRLASESATVIHKLYKSGESIPRVNEDSILQLLKP